MAQPTSLRQNLSLFLPLYLPGLLFSFSYSLLIPVLPLYAQSFGVSYGLVGLVLAGDSIGMLIGDLPAGILMRRWGQKSTMIIGLILSGVSTTAIFWAPSILMIVLMRMLAGMGSSLFSVSRHYFLTETTPPASRGRIISLFGGFVRGGRLAGPIIGGTIATAFGLRSSFLAFGVTCLVALIIVIYFLPHVEIERHELTASRGSMLSGMKAMLKLQWRSFCTAGPGLLFIQFIRSGPPVIIPLYAANLLGLDVGSIGIIMSISSTLDMLLFYPTGILMDRWGRKIAIVSSCVIQAVGLALVPFAGSFGTLLMAGMVWGLGNGLGAGVMLTLGSDLAPRDGRSEFLGTWTLIGDAGSTFGPLAIGEMADAIPLPVTAWVVACGGLLAAVIFATLVPETLKWRHITEVSAGRPQL